MSNGTEEWLDDSFPVATECYHSKRLEPSCPDRWAPSLQESCMEAKFYVGGQTVNKKANKWHQESCSRAQSEAPTRSGSLAMTSSLEQVGGAAKPKVSLCDFWERAS